MTATASSYQNAITKSRKLDPTLSRTRHLGGYTYEVAGEHGTYRAVLQGDTARCTCEAGRNDRACWHLASSWRMRVARRAAQ